ncbi:glycosyl hydrolase family 65 protein [Streptomyces sp. GESEQ-35]|uniref:MGH1-like glycoside hydrolase domain-containing protein n=1 Tax=Streptomyces sp. GESEQ-35 TaxID=2812657 RepID=UPI001B340317|nr:glycosyl hydrolase family 65 protein [Streptomyces sp. GESEQ-35]
MAVDEQQRISRRRFLTALGAAGSGIVPLRAEEAAGGNGYTMPSLVFEDPATQRRLGGLYATALTDLAGAHSVRADPSVYDRAGLLTDPPGTVVRAGGGYPAPQRWTRDAAVNAWHAVSLLAPAVGRNTLWSVVERGPDGLIVQQDNQWWDQIVWVPAAWHHYQVTGDRAFLAQAYETSVHTLAARRARDFDATYGLFRGPGFMNDGISGYPDPPASDRVRSSFVLDHPGTDRVMCLSTNCLYYGARSVLADMAETLGETGLAASFRADAAELRRAVDRHLWRPEAGTYAYLLHATGQADTSQEGAGLALALLLGVADRHQARQVLDTTHWQPHGIVNVWPHFPRFGDTRPGRHNVMVWPLVHGLYGQAAADAGRTDLFARAVDLLAGLFSGTGFYELYDSVSGAVDGGWQTGGSGRAEHFVSQPDQTWSGTAYLRLLHEGLFGLTFTENALRLRPCLPEGWGPVSLRGLRYRDMTLDIGLSGSGSRVRSCTVDGRPGEPVVPADGTGHHTVHVALDDDVLGLRS